mmetsp:Transcript_12719/g.34159  ORF Transcript_12719/g.34159 Transcript_12719/m.34159 type:complete len:267 (+) Transcript_12719:853-1653(+)
MFQAFHRPHQFEAKILGGTIKRFLPLQQVFRPAYVDSEALKVDRALRGQHGRTQLANAPGVQRSLQARHAMAFSSDLLQSPQGKHAVRPVDLEPHFLVQPSIRHPFDGFAQLAHVVSARSCSFERATHRRHRELPLMLALCPALRPENREPLPDFVNQGRKLLVGASSLHEENGLPHFDLVLGVKGHFQQRFRGRAITLLLLRSYLDRREPLADPRDVVFDLCGTSRRSCCTQDFPHLRGVIAVLPHLFRNTLHNIPFFHDHVVVR